MVPQDRVGQIAAHQMPLGPSLLARNGQVLRWQKLTEEDWPETIFSLNLSFLCTAMKDSVEKHRFSRWFSVRWESLAKPKGPQKRLAEARGAALGAAPKMG